MGMLTVALVAWVLSGAPEPGGAAGAFVGKTLTVRGQTYRYSVYLPPGYQKGKAWPVILGLHGAGSRGTDGLRPRTQSMAEAARTHPQRYPALLVLPQCPPGRDWSGDVADSALQALERTLAEYGGDRNRVYLTGQSLGARGVLRLAALYPERFAAVVAVSGRRPEGVEPSRLKGTPLWVWHGAEDTVVPVSESQQLVAGLEAGGHGAVLYTELSGQGHDIFDTVYLDEAVSTWLFAQRRK